MKFLSPDSGLMRGWNNLTDGVWINILMLVWIMGFEWVWALQARFENSLGGTLANAFIFGVTNVASTIALAIIDVAFLGLIVGSWFYMPQGLFLLVVLGYGSVLMLHVPILEHAFAKYVNKPESDGRGTVWRK